MADILASVSVVLGAEVSAFKAGMADARRELKGLIQFSEGLRDIGKSLTTYVSLPIAALGAASVAASGKVESLKKGLEAITLQELGQQGVTGLAALSQASEQTTQRLSELREIAKTPGLGFEGAVQGDVRLRAVGISAEQSAKSIKAFANAIATTGGGKNEFDRVTVQLAQLSAKGKVLAQDLRPIIEAAPAVAAALQRLYGTVDSETISASLAKQGQSSKDFIAILTTELEKLPQVEGGLKNAFENLGDNATLALAKIGDGISKTLNVPGLVAGLSGALDSLATGFANLPAPIQGAVVGLAALTAATGPVLLGLGTLGVALPNIKAGFAALQGASVLLQNNMVALRGALAAVLSPTGAIVAALVTLGAVIYAANTEGKRAYETYLQQSQATQQLSASLTPLLARYEELKGKTSLSAAEQEELRAVMQKVADIVPDATSKLDANGRVAEINAGKVRALVQAQQEYVQALAIKSLPDQQKELAQAEAYNQKLKQRLDYFNETGKFQQNIGLGLTRDYTPSAESVTNFRVALAQSNVALLTQRQSVEELNRSAGTLASTLTGELTPALSETDLALKFLGGQGEQATGLLAGLHEQLKQLKEAQQDAPTEKLALAYNPLIKNLQEYIAKLEGSSKEGKKAEDALKNLRQELVNNANASRALGNLYEFLPGKAKILESGIKSLTDAGFAPGGKVVQQYVAQLRAIPQAMEQIAARMVKGSEKLFETPDFELKVPKLADVPNQLQPINSDGLVTSYDEAGAKLTAAQERLLDRRRLFNTEMGELTEQLNASIGPELANLAVIFGDAFGSVVTGISSASEAFAALFGGILESIGGFMSSFGQQLITIGIGKLALDSLFAGPQGGPLAIAAGIGLVALAGVVKAVGKSASSSLKSIGSGGGSSYSSPSGGGYSQGSSTQTIKVVGEFVLRGKTLVAAVRSDDYRSDATD